MPKQAVIYHRTNNKYDHIDNLYSLKRQDRSVKQLLINSNHFISKQFTDIGNDEEDSLSNRKELKRMMDYVMLGGEIDIIIESPRQISVSTIGQLNFQDFLMQNKRVSVLCYEDTDFYKYACSDNAGIRSGFQILATTLEYHESSGKNLKSYYDRMFSDFK